MPAWAIELARRSDRERSTEVRSEQVTLGAAAVLVLLTDSPNGPAVLLTERAHDLRHSPGQLVFPGGAADPGDDGPIGTALREAPEETSLEPSSVHIIGTLPALALSDSGFLLTPVLAWSPMPQFTASANLAEVLSVSTMPVLPKRARQVPRSCAADASETATMEASPARLGAATALVIDLLAGMLGHLDSSPTGAAIPSELPG